MKTKTILLLPAVLLFTGIAAQNLKISSAFPGGNIVVNKIKGDTVWLKPDLSFTEGDWFYWYFKISGTAGKKIRFQFEQDNVFTRYGPAYSINNNKNWKWYGENRVSDNGFTFDFAPEDTVGYFSMAFPYTAKSLYEFLESTKNSESCIIDTLCLSPENRIVEKIIISSVNGTKRKVLITARHHACEMMASYVLEGIINSLLNDVDLQDMRGDTEFLIIPFMDKDGVENGEQGKNRIPRDHNRDYDDEPVHNSTAALKKFVSEWSNGKLKFALDLHCPWIHGNRNEDIYIVGAQYPEIEAEQKVFSKLLEKHSSGEIKSIHKNFLPFGEAWNTGANYTKGISFAGWAAQLEGIEMATTLEYPYSNISGMMVMKDNSRIFGKNVAYSIKEYFDSLDKK